MKVHTDVSSKTMYLAKNQRTIEYFRDEKISRRESNRTLNTTKTDQSYKYVEEMSLKEKAKNFIECYEDLILIITQKA